MFKLFKLNENKYSLNGPHVNFEGNLVETIHKMKGLMRHMDEEEKNEEVEAGLKAVEEHDFAEYGIVGKFIFSANFTRNVS